MYQDGETQKIFPLLLELCFVVSGKHDGVFLSLRFLWFETDDLLQIPVSLWLRSHYESLNMWESCERTDFYQDSISQINKRVFFSAKIHPKTPVRQILDLVLCINNSGGNKTGKFTDCLSAICSLM